MKNKWIIPVVILGLSSLAACGQEEAYEGVIVPDAPVITTTTRATEPATTKQTTVKTKKTTKTTKATTTAATTTTTAAATTKAEDDYVRYAEDLSAEELHNVNIFLSNFAEQGIEDYDSETTNVWERAYFGYINTKINDRGTYDKFVAQNDIVVPLEYLSERSERFFGKPITEDEIKKTKNPYNSVEIYYREGNFHFTGGSGESYTYMACVHSVVDLTNGSHSVKFTVYDMSSLCSETVDAKYYDMTSEQLEKAGAKVSAYGVAIITDNKYNDKDTYILDSYYALPNA